MISVSYRLVSLRTSRTVISRALMSSRAVTAIFCSLLDRRIRCGTVKVITVNISQNGSGKQTAKLRPARSATRERGANRRCRDLLWRHGDAQDGTGQLARYARRIRSETALPLHLERRR